MIERVIVDNGYVKEDTFGQFFLVFDCEYDMREFQDSHPDFQGLPWACCNGYMNAIVLSEPVR